MPLFRRKGKGTPEDQFAGEIIELVRELLGVKAEPTANFALLIPQPGRTPITMNLQTVLLEAQRLSGDERAHRLRTAVLAMAQTDRPKTWEEARPLLLPAVRSASWAAAGGPIETVRRGMAPFVKELAAIDSEYAMTFVTVDDLRNWSVDTTDVYRAAQENLLEQPLEVIRDGPVAVVVGPDGYVSSWLATPTALDRVAQDLGTSVVAIAPGRDHLLLIDASNPDTVLAPLEQAITDYEQDPRSLSPVPYAISDTGITPWNPPAGHPAEQVVARTRGILAAVEYQYQRQALEDLHTKLEEDVFIAQYTLMERDDGTVWSWGSWVRQVTDGLLPEAEVVILGDNDDKDATFGVRWSDALRLAGSALRRDPGYDPPLFRHHGWPSPDVLAQLKAVAVPLPPPP